MRPGKLARAFAPVSTSLLLLFTSAFIARTEVAPGPGDTAGNDRRDLPAGVYIRGTALLPVCISTLTLRFPLLLLS